MVEISIPCEECKRPIRFGDSRALMTTAETSRAARLALLEYLVTAGVFAACWRAARGAPVLAISGATSGWLLIQALSSWSSGFLGLWIKGVALILLIRGIVASVRAHGLRRKLKAAR